jgi:uncharacterized repeat protein (TIGR03803 family)
VKGTDNAESGLDLGKRAYAVFALCAATAISLPAQTFTTLHTFTQSEGQGLLSSLVQGTDGNLYGTTGYAGACSLCGTVFKITPSGTLTTLHKFTGGTDGSAPSAGLIQATNGDFYGTTSSGGANNRGTVFKITPSGTLTTLYSFCSKSFCADGDWPLALVQATNGDLYGTTLHGGLINCGQLFTCGTVFKITLSGTLTTLHSFNYNDGSNPAGGLIQGSDGDLYGTTEFGWFRYGTVFKITPSGTLTTLYGFCPQPGCADGAEPQAGLIQAADGDFYGTTYFGGANGRGAVFKITPSGTLTTLHSFDSTDGQNPQAGLVQATDGDFYGTTYNGGSNNLGTVFKMTSSGMLTTLHSVDHPAAALVQDTNGTFYGTTYGGSTVFSLSVGLGPFVETLPTSGEVGSSVDILGTDLTGATSVTFNGTEAKFAVESSNLIKATVPTGASTGKVQVVTPSGTLSSNVPFRIP